MAKKLIIEAQVNTEQVDKAVAKLGQLKDLGRGLKIQYDIDGKPLDVVIDKSKNLQQQVKILTAELRKTKEGTDEFTLLSTKLSDAQDGLAKTTAKSKDLFSSLSMIPGPVGQFFSQLQGGIELLKTFSSFTFKDLKFQFKETANDIADIGKNLGTIDTTDIDGIKESTDEANQSFRDAITDSADLARTQTLINGRRLNEYETEVAALKNLENAQNKGNVAQQFKIGLVKDEITKRDLVPGIIKQTTDAEGNLTTTTRALTTSELQLAAANKNVTVSTEGMVVAQKSAVFWTTTLGTTIKTVLISTGILAAVVILGELVSMIYKYVTSSEEAERATNDFTDAIKYQNEILEANLGQIDFESKKKLLLAKIAGESEEKLNEITQQGLENRFKLIRDANSAALQEQKDLANRVGKFAKISDETRATLLEKNLENLKKLGDDEIKAREAIELNKLQIQATAAEKLREGVKKTGDKQADLNKANAQKIVDDTKKANDLLLKLQQENNVNKLDTERKKQDAQLKIDKANEERDINNLKINEELKGKLLEQVRVKYGIKVIDLNKKRQEEDNKSFDESQKKLKEYQDKIAAIFIASDDNELSRNKAARAKKFEDDKAALEKDVNFQKETLERKITILMALEKAFNQDIQKLDDDDAQKGRDKNLKKLDDELRFLQIKGEALRQGTKSFFDNQRAILKTAEKKELADLEDRAAKEKMSAEKLAAEKLAIQEKYLKAAKDLSDQELQAVLAAVQATLGAAQTIAGDIAKVAQLGQQIALEELNKRYIAENELDKKNITNKEQQEAKLLANKKKFAKEEDEIKKKAFEENKKIQIAQAIIATLQSAVGAYSSLIAIPFVGPVLAPIAAAAALFFGYKQVDLIKKTQYQSSLALSESETPSATTKTNYGRNYEKGGMIGGKRHAEGGTLIEAERGEAIMTRGAVASFGPLLSLMNQAGGGTSFNSNLITTRQDNPIVNNPTQEQNPLIVKTYVVSQELTTEAQRQARLKNLSTI
jgi:hypothetical protein